MELSWSLQVLLSPQISMSLQGLETAYDSLQGSQCAGSILNLSTHMEILFWFWFTFGCSVGRPGEQRREIMELWEEDNHINTLRFIEVFLV